jgi:hypothetical protein
MKQTNMNGVSAQEAKQYDLLDGIYEEILMTEKKLKGEKMEWNNNCSDTVNDSRCFLFDTLVCRM